MKAKEVLSLLGISRITLMSYVKKGLIKTVTLPNGFYSYDRDSVLSFINGKKTRRYNAVYCRVSTFKQKNDLKTQINFVSNFCTNRNIPFTLFSDISSGIDFDRPQFSSLLNDVLNYKVDTIYISYRDRISRLSYSVISNIFEKFGTKIVVVSDVLDKKYPASNDTELLEDLTSLMHYFTTKKYSNRKNKLT